MRRTKLLSVCLAALSLGMLLGGCTRSSNKTVYQYNETEIVDGFILTKSIYEADKLTLYFESNLDEDEYKVHADCEIEYEIKKGRVEITADDVSEITSLTIEDYQFMYKLRYLDTNQYAVLAYSWTYDVGWEDKGGDIEDYYTKEELEAQERRTREYQERFDSNWALVEGYYEADNGKSIEFYTNDEGERTLRRGEEIREILGISIDGKRIYITCDADYLEYEIDGEIAEDGSYIVVYDAELKADVKYNKKYK